MKQAEDVVRKIRKTQGEEAVAEFERLSHRFICVNTGVCPDCGGTDLIIKQQIIEKTNHKIVNTTVTHSCGFKYLKDSSTLGYSGDDYD